MLLVFVIPFLQLKFKTFCSNSQGINIAIGLLLFSVTVQNSSIKK